MEASGRTDPRTRALTASSRARRLALLGGGPEGNERLTTVAGAVLVVLLAVLGVTIIRIGQLLWLHLFLGLLLLGPVALKMASTGYRFARYYTRNPAYVHKGPPEPILRGIAPIVVVSTLVVFITGIVLLAVGVSGRGELVEIHKVSFIVWVVFMALHVLGHLPAYARYMRESGSEKDRLGTRPAPPVAGSCSRAGSWWV